MKWVLPARWGVHIYRGKNLLYKGQKQILMALLDGKALVCNSAIDHLNTYQPNCAGYDLIDIETGQKVKSVKIERYLGKSSDRKHLFISFTSSPSPVLSVIHVNNPTELIKIEGLDKIMEMGFPVYRVNESSPYRNNIATGKDELIEGYKVPNVNARDGSKVLLRDNHILAFERYGDFTVIDVNKGKSVSSVPLYSGWWKFEDMAYLKGINKLLVVHYAPIYTSPNPGENDPGASAYTIDVATGEIRPYLISENRQQYQVRLKDIAEKMAYQYSPAGKCEMRNNQYRKGSTIFQDGNPYGIIVGYDCEEEVYVVAYRELYDPGVYIIRATKKTFEELGKYRQDNAHYVICPLCNGQPVSLRKETTSGWSNWEQKSLNIYVYTRKWETKTNVIRELCKTCKGAAWLKR